MKKLHFVLCLAALLTACSNNEFEENVLPNQSNEVTPNSIKDVTELTPRAGYTYRIITFSAGRKIYRANQTSTINWTALSQTPVQADDWANALYFWDEELKNYLDSDHPYFVEVTLKKTLKIIDTDYLGFTDGSYDMNQVIADVEKVVGSKKPAGTPFLLWLGQKGYAFRYFENMDKEIAVVIPHPLLSDDFFSQEVTDTYKK
ncbi:hypothetical protein DW228_18355 [Bacteroides fragilis]|uniref:Lipoprotein n=1 Tax=Bacteroides fragilis TaxID=817 RepID=A0A396BPI5_BACFG|nr:hypothetical protein [Bacteroides fragilis]RHH07896.1 hypothetical protein DW228_18355 [Bacteroides fragilis]